MLNSKQDGKRRRGRPAPEILLQEESLGSKTRQEKRVTSRDSSVEIRMKGLHLSTFHELRAYFSLIFIFPYNLEIFIFYYLVFV